MGVSGILAVLVWRAVVGTTAWPRPAAWAVVLTAAYAATDELHQAFVVGCHASVVDVAIDTTGALIVLLALEIVRSFRSRGREPRGPGKREG